MSLTLTNRLDKLENEIRLMLMLQKCGNQDGQQCMTTVNTTSNQIMHSTGMAAGSNSTKGDGQRCSPTRCSIQCGKAIPSPRSSVAGDSPARSGKNGSQSCCCAVAAKFMETHTSRPPSRGSCSCGRSPERDLEIERQLRREMEEEVNRLKLQIADMLQSKCMALNMTKQLKQRYEKMKGIHEDTATKLSNLQRENEFLARSLEKEKMEKGKTSSSVQVSKDLGHHSIKKMKEKDAKIKSLNDSLLSLSRTVEDKEFEKKRLEHEKHKIHEKLKMNKDITKKLSETNAKLAKSVKQKHDSFLAIRNKAGKYEKELGEYKEEVRRSQMELERLKSEIARERSRQDSLLSAPKVGVENLEEKLKKTKDKERRASETIQLLSQQLRDLEHKDPKPLEKELQRVNKELKAMQQKYEEALNKLKQYEIDEKKRADMSKTEMQTLTNDLAAKEAKYLEEMEQMKQLIEQLQSEINEHMKRIEELEAVKQQQDIVIKTQTEQLNSKEEQIKLREREIDLVKEQCLELDKQVDNLRTSIDEFEKIGSKTMVQTSTDLKERINNLTNEVDSLKADLRDEKLKSDTKDKVVADQYNTIEDLKGKLADLENELRNYSAKSRDSEMRARTSKEQVERMSRELVKEKEYTRQTVSQLTSMKKQKKKLEKDVEELEEAYDEYSSVSFLQRLDQEQKQWNEEKQKLMKERDRAIDAARLATKTLMETMDDFQGQIKSQQKLQKIVTDIISSKSQSRLPPCMRRREGETYKQMQVAIPCKPTIPQCNLRCNFPILKEDNYYTTESGRYSCHSDSDDTAGASEIFNFIGQYSGNYSPITRASTSRSPSAQPLSPSIPRPLPPSSNHDCRCINRANNQCQCAQRSSIPIPIGEQGKQKKCYCRR